MEAHLNAMLSIAAAMITVISAGPASPAPGASKEPGLNVTISSSSVVDYRYPGYGVLLDVGAYVVARGASFEMRLRRPSYDQQIGGTVAFRDAGRRSRENTLPRGLLQNFTGIPDFLHLVLSAADGREVLNTTRPFCPANDARRVLPTAATRSRYPQRCSLHPFTLGAVWGIEKGWAARLADISSGPVQLPDGTYTAEVDVPKPYQRLFAMPDRHYTVTVTVRDADGPPGGTPNDPPAGTGADALTPTGTPHVPASARPDLRSLPAWGLFVVNGDAAGGASGEPGREYLMFIATVWNGGAGPLVVKGFRRSGSDVMDSYQFFLDVRGRQTGYWPAGAMQWDSEHGHDHWHLTDFATYSLQDSDRQTIVRSQKEGFCLANTDAIDYTVKNAVWQPDHDSLATSCGELTSRSVSEVLQVGNGDTYVQDKAGQAFDITDLANGTYYIHILANPLGRLVESDLGNNESFRQFTLGGTRGARFVTVPPVGFVNS